MIILIIPPVSDCFMPTLGIAQIAGYLKNANVACKVHDIGAEINYQIFESVINGDEIIKRMVIEGETYTYRNLVSALNYYSLVNDYFEIGSDYFNARCDWKDVEAATEYINNDIILSDSYLKLSSVSRICSDENKLICGISISYESQVIPSLILARVLKENNSKVKICIGGSLLYNYEEIFYKYLYISDFIDYLIIGPGEMVFEHIEKKDFTDIMTNYGIKVKEFDGHYVIDSRDSKQLPVVYKPDFMGFDFRLYPVINKAFPYMIKDKCYYGKCRFCNGDKVMTQDNCKDVSSAFEMMNTISYQIHINNVYIVDAALSPMDFVKIGNLPEKQAVTWIANARFEKKLMDEELIKGISKNGCVMLRFGFESGSQKVLDFMNKGTNVEVAERILFLTNKYNIKNHLYVMFGYPGEGKKERKETLDFLDRNKDYIYSYSISVFQPIPGTPVYKELADRIDEHDNEYERIIEMVYPDENDYQDLRNDILRVGDVLKDYAQTNIEYYSANIFNDETHHDRNFYIFEYERYLDFYSEYKCFSEKIDVDEKTDIKKKKYVYVDYYNKIIVFLFVSKETMDLLLSSNITDDNQRIKELRKILDNSRVKREYRYYNLSDLKRNLSNEMSIQFMP